MPGNSSPIVLLGFAPWSSLANRESLINPPVWPKNIRTRRVGKIQSNDTCNGCLYVLVTGACDLVSTPAIELLVLILITSMCALKLEERKHPLLPKKYEIDVEKARAARKRNQFQSLGDGLYLEPHRVFESIYSYFTVFLMLVVMILLLARVYSE